MGTLVDSLASRLSAIVLNDAQSNGIPSSMIGPIEKSLAVCQLYVLLALGLSPDDMKRISKSLSTSSTRW